ncbi:hypothetical protein [Actinoplanes sp. NPDC049265]|uniref:hypothetical protein n=1 Tax=Actinoplanes sp. NPDC049265 TaxID=3363902 RepID=UPI003718AD0C
MPDWTDDMTITLPPARTIPEVVEFVLAATLRQVPPDQIAEALAADLGLSPDDAELAADRALGGLVRAATRTPDNRPDQAKDPVAWESFHRGIRDPSLVERIYPQFARKPD